MVKEFKEKNYWALILGGSSGLGLATAKKLSKHGMNLLIVHRDRKTDLDKINREFKEIRENDVDVKTFNIDATNIKKIEPVVSGIHEILGGTGKIRAVVHSIAKGNLKPMLGADSLKTTDFQLTLQAMALNLYDWVKLIFSENLFAEDARVIAFTSEGNTKAWKNYAAVSAAKVTLEALVRNMALEFAPYGIRANCLQAGFTNTKSFRMIPGNEVLKKHSLQRNPFKRLTTPKNVANVVYLLCKDEAAWINGTVIPVDGGEHLG